MPSNSTQNYNLNQWAAGDRVLRTDFNADNAKIDAAIKAVDQRVDGKADISALSALQTTVAQKADASALAAKGNCQVEYGTYVGTGVYGNSEATATVLQLGYRPRLLVVASSNGAGMAMFLSPCPGTTYLYGAGTLYLAVRWMNDGLQWNPTGGNNGPADQLNESGVTYYYAAFR